MFEEPEKFEEELKEDLYKDLEHKKIEHTYIEPQVQDAETIEKETKKENNEFFVLDKKINEIDNAATEQKKKKITSSIYLMICFMKIILLTTQIKQKIIY